METFLPFHFKTTRFAFSSHTQYIISESQEQIAPVNYTVLKS